MIGAYIIGIIGTISLMVIWIGIQSLWRKTFAKHVSDEDAMAERTKCGNCSCTTICMNKTDHFSTQNIDKIKTE